MKDFEWCTDCKEYDNEKHCCPRWNKVIRTTLNDNINAVLDDIRAEIDIERFIDKDTKLCKNANASGLEVALQIIDKYKAESEHKRMIDADELLKRIAGKCKTPSLSKDTINGLCGATAIIYDMLNESGKEK